MYTGRASVQVSSVYQVRPARRFLRLIFIGCLALVVATAVVLADVPHTRAEADQMLQKIALIATNGLAQRPAERHTTVTEGELNSFLAVHARSELPAGVIDPVIKIGPAGRLTGTAIVDLDAVRKARRDDGFSAVSLLTGRLPIQAAGVLRTSNGVGRFELQEAWVSSIPIPKALLQEIVAHYSRTPDAPEGIDLDAPFELPAAIREIRTGQGQAIVVQ
jgi:hypothetical protein